MGARAVAALGSSVEQVVAISADAAVAGLGVQVRADAVAGQGPLGGIRTALEWAIELGLDGVVILACDLPLVSAPLIEAICSVWDAEEVVLPVTPAGVEPLCALYAASVLLKVQAALARGELSPSRLVRELTVHSLDIEVARRVTRLENPFLNVNTKDACELAEALLHGARTSLAGGTSRHHM
jgi:molybdopterin-guanine dinucleotide biosynthesis protein A